MDIIWYEKAEIDLYDNVGYVAKKSPQNAIMVLNTLSALPENLKTFPFAYPKEPMYNKENIRYITKWSYKLVFRIEKDTIYILRVFNSNMNPNKIIEK